MPKAKTTYTKSNGSAPGFEAQLWAAAEQAVRVPHYGIAEYNRARPEGLCLGLIFLNSIFPNQAFGYWKVVVERPVRLPSRLTVKAVEALRFASGDEEIRSALYDELGDALFENFGTVQTELEQLVVDWGNGEDENEEGEAGGRPQGLPEKKKKKLLDSKTWERDGRLVKTATALRKELGGDLFEDHNVFRERVNEALEKLKIKLSASDLKLILRAVSWRVETAPPVIAKIHNPAKGGGATAIKADPLRGFFSLPPSDEERAGVRGKPEVVVEYEADPDLRDTEQVPLLEPGASRHSSAAKCCPTRPTRGLMTPPRRLVTRFPSRATSTNRNRSARWKKSARTFWRWKRKPKACSARS
jgi:hypothetical protein